MVQEDGDCAWCEWVLKVPAFHVAGMDGRVVLAPVFLCLVRGALHHHAAQCWSSSGSFPLELERFPPRSPLDFSGLSGAITR